MESAASINYDGLDKYFNLVDISANSIYNSARKSGGPSVTQELKEDLVQSGYIALLEAWTNFDASKASFKTYAFYRIRGAMIDHLRGEDTVPKATRTAIKKRDSDLAKNKESSLSSEESHKLDSKAIWLRQLHQHTGSDGEEYFEDPVFMDSSNSYSSVDNAETVSKLFKLCLLTEKETRVISDHYFKDIRFTDIGTALNVSESRITQIHKSALRKLKKYV